MPSLTTHLVSALREAFEGPQPEAIYFSDRTASGVFGTVTALTPAQASQPSGKSGTSAAAHLHHLAFSCPAFAAWIRGEQPELDWNESWRLRTVDAAGLKALEGRLRDGYAKLLQAIEQHGASNDQALGIAVGAVTHTVYHLAVVRQKAGQ
jgi:uncharacterized damage-inducible protein DinB